jgi:hypothetical protein
MSSEREKFLGHMQKVVEQAIGMVAGDGSKATAGVQWIMGQLHGSVPMDAGILDGPAMWRKIAAEERAKGNAERADFADWMAGGRTQGAEVDVTAPLAGGWQRGPFGYTPIMDGFKPAYRVHDGADNRIATCYDEANAQFIVGELNRAALSGRAAQSGDVPCCHKDCRCCEGWAAESQRRRAAQSEPVAWGVMYRTPEGERLDPYTFSEAGAKMHASRFDPGKARAVALGIIGTPGDSDPTDVVMVNRLVAAAEEFVLVGYVHPDEVAGALFESGEEGWGSLPLAPEPFGPMTMPLYRRAKP